MRMLHLVVFLLSTTIGGTWGASLPSNSAALPQLDGRIVGGNVTTIDLFPWQVSLQTLNGDHVCGGAIINKEIILTAAHCLLSVTPDKIQIRVGSSYWSRGGMTFKAANLQNHPEFKAEVLMNDVALIRLVKPLTFGPTIQPIQLATESPANRAVAKVSGWGTTSFGSETLPHQLISVDVNIVSRDICGSSVYGYRERIKRTMICAAAAGKDSCQGDSGGPLVSDGLIVGIVSWGYGCALANYPGVYADVAELSYWIKETSEVLLKTNCTQNLC